MKNQFSGLLQNAKRNGMKDGVTACRKILPLAVYNTLMRKCPDMPFEDMGKITTEIDHELMQILGDGPEQDFLDEVEHALTFVCERMGIKNTWEANRNV